MDAGIFGVDSLLAWAPFCLPTIGVAAVAAVAAVAGSASALMVLPWCVRTLVRRVAKRTNGACLADDAASHCVPSRRVVAACGVLQGAAWGCAVIAVVSVMPSMRFAAALAAGVWLVSTGSMLCALACDVTARVIPRELCWTLGAAGACHQLLANGPMALFAGALFGAVAAFLGALANGVPSARSGEPLVGGGDVRCMAALSLATGCQAFLGFFLCFLAAGAWALFGCLRAGFTARATLPLAPFFCLWLFAGTAMD